MSIPGCDYSYNPPTPAELKAAGMKFACRYLVGRAPKKLTATEVQALTKAGIALVSNYESSEGFMLDGGFAKGVTVAKAAWAIHKAVGGPDHRPIYFSADTDPGGWTAAQWTSFDRFLDGAASVLGKQGVGVYGGTLALRAADAGGSCGWFWQALGWHVPRGVWLDWVHLQQWNNGEVLGSGEVDYDRALQADYGQWSATGEDIPLDAETKTYIDSKFDALAGRLDRAVLKLGGVDNTIYSSNADSPRPLPDMAKTVDLKDVLAAASAGQPVVISQAQLDEIKAALQRLEGSALVQLAVSPAP